MVRRRYPAREPIGRKILLRQVPLLFGGGSKKFWKGLPDTGFEEWKDFDRDPRRRVDADSRRPDQMGEGKLNEENCGRVMWPERICDDQGNKKFWVVAHFEIPFL